MFVPRTQASPRLRLVGLSSSLEKPNVINRVFMASECSGGLGHTLLLQLFSSSALASPSHQLHSREIFFLEAAISRKRKVELKLILVDVMFWMQELIYSLLPGNVHIAWKNYFKLLTISR